MSTYTSPRMSLAGTTVMFGGSFNPPHLGHQMACLYLLEGCGAEAVWLLPSFRHPFGKPLADFNHRFAMCEAMADALGGRVQVHDVERTLAGAGRTYDIVVHLQNAYPAMRFALAIGADLLGECDQWYRWSELCARVQVVVVGREGYPAQGDAVAMPNISSSALRARLARGDSVRGLVPIKVAGYIAEHGLYRLPLS